MAAAAVHASSSPPLAMSVAREGSMCCRVRSIPGTNQPCHHTKHSDKHLRVLSL
jgi:hypothetical protein